MSKMRRRERRQEMRPTDAPKGFRPSKIHGQNLLIDDETLALIVDYAEIESSDNILEIGAGTGRLTRLIAPLCGSMLAVEIDADLVFQVRKIVKHHKHVKVMRRDVRSIDLETIFPGETYSVLGNLPYNIGTPTTVDLLQSNHRPYRLTVMLQLEVAQRMCAKPGSMSLLSLLIQSFGSPELLFQVPPDAFWPVPKVHSALVRIVSNGVAADDPIVSAYLMLARHAFAGRRKKIHNSLSAGLHISVESVRELCSESVIDPNIRPQELDLAAWRRLGQTMLDSHLVAPKS